MPRPWRLSSSNNKPARRPRADRNRRTSMSSFSTALSGLSADNLALDVVGNNLANLTTTGFKSDSVQFEDLLQQISGGAQIGGGVASPTTERSFTQGSI